MSDLHQRIKHILTRDKQVDNDVSGGYDVEFARMPKPKMTASAYVGSGMRGGKCCMCGGMMEYDNPNMKGSSVSEMMNYAVANNALSGNGRVKRVVNGKNMVCREVKPRKPNTKGVEALKRFQDKVKKLMANGFTRKEAIDILKRYKAEGDGFFDDLWSGVKDVASIAAPFVPLLI